MNAQPRSTGPGGPRSTPVRPGYRDTLAPQRHDPQEPGRERTPSNRTVETVQLLGVSPAATRFLLQPRPCRTTPTRGTDQRAPGKPPTRITSHRHPGGSIRHDWSRLSTFPAPSGRPFDLPLGPPVRLSASLRLCGGPEQPELRPACASNLPRSIGVREIPPLSPQNPQLSPANGLSSPRRPADVPRISPARVRRSRRRSGQGRGCVVRPAGLPGQARARPAPRTGPRLSGPAAA